MYGIVDHDQLPRSVSMPNKTAVYIKGEVKNTLVKPPLHGFFKFWSKGISACMMGV